MNYTEALKQVTAAKPKENYMVIRFGYDSQFLLPHSDGQALIAALAKAEKITETYSKPKRILELERDSIQITSFSHQEYVRWKVAALLDCTPEEIKEYAEKGLDIPPPPSPDAKPS